MKMPFCPVCKNTNSVRQAHRRPMDQVLRLVRRYAFRCDSCSTRFYRFYAPGKQQFTPSDREKAA